VAEPILTVDGLNVDFWVDGQWYPAAVDVDFSVRPGEVLAIVGESGSGKTTSAMSLLGLLPVNARTSGSIKLGGKQLVGAKPAELRSVRGKDIAVIFQEPMTALNPVYRIGFQISEALRSHSDMAPSRARERAIELLRLVEISEPERRVDSYPHQLSGGQRQRAMIAQALANDPVLLVADEPTTALDVTVQAEILKLLHDLRHRIDSGIVLITHDMGVVADMADRILVMKDGRIVESGTSDDIFHRPQHEYTRELLAAVPHLGAETPSEPEAAPEKPPAPVSEPVLVLNNVSIEYPKRGRVPAFRAVEGASLTIGRGEIVGLVGESGSGKTTIGRAAVGLMPIADGELTVGGTDLSQCSNKALREVRRRVSFVFQDPGSSLNPRLPIGESIGEPLFLQQGIKGDALHRRVEKLLDDVHLPRAMRNRYPHELSGGQRQRVGIARALALEPTLLVADEPTSALDVSVQAKVLKLLQELQLEHGFACLFISHDLAVVEILAHRIAVMRQGRLVEVGDREAVLNNPQDPYTQRLLAAVPVPDPDEQRVRRERREALLEAERQEQHDRERPRPDPGDGPYLDSDGGGRLP
jgi:peptide/nickel transport system ATP-binding protein